MPDELAWGKLAAQVPLSGQGRVLLACVVVSRQDVVEPVLDSEMVAEKYNVNIFRARPITIVDGNKRLKITTAEQTPALIAKAAGMTLYREDKTQFTNSENLLVNGAGLVMKI